MEHRQAIGIGLPLLTTKSRLRPLIVEARKHRLVFDYLDAEQIRALPGGDAALSPYTPMVSSSAAADDDDLLVTLTGARAAKLRVGLKSGVVQGPCLRVYWPTVVASSTERVGVSR